MKAIQLAKSALIIFTLFGVIACSSTSEEEPIIEELPQAVDSDQAGLSATQQRTAQLQEEARRRAIEAEERVQRAALTTNIFYFDLDVAEFRDSDRETLAAHARDLAANPNKRIRLEGHADERGTREYNLALGERRAEAVQNYLIVNGASRSQIEVVSYGEEQPADRGTNERAYQQNRRVEIMPR